MDNIFSTKICEHDWQWIVKDFHRICRKCRLNQKGKTIKQKSDIGIPERFVIAMTDSGWIRRNTIIWYKPNCMPSSAKDRFTVDFEYFYFFTKSPKYYFETQYEPFSDSPVGWRKDGRTAINGKGNGELSKRNRFGESSDNGRIKRSVWRINTKPFPEAHFAVFPEELITTPIKACCPQEICNKCGKPKETQQIKTGEFQRRWSKNNQEGSPYKKQSSMQNVYEYEIVSCNCNAGFHSGVVLDPFMGAGTVGVVAKKLGRRFVGVELNPEYIKISEKRIGSIL